mmetsp:Transcript_9465/g.12284  ORF Transcript_9465/g.12284 Transcript_9465/m.12284 type:complete len:206 (+) Transcript_9465:155-772(+)
MRPFASGMAMLSISRTTSSWLPRTQMTHHTSLGLTKCGMSRAAPEGLEKRRLKQCGSSGRQTFRHQWRILYPAEVPWRMKYSSLRLRTTMTFAHYCAVATSWHAPPLLPGVPCVAQTRIPSTVATSTCRLPRSFARTPFPPRRRYPSRRHRSCCPAPSKGGALLVKKFSTRRQPPLPTCCRHRAREPRRVAVLVLPIKQKFLRAS